MRIVGAGLVLAAATMALPAQAQDVADWGGFYASVFAGYGLGSADSSSSASGPTTIVQGGTTITFADANSLSRIDGLVGGLGAGYNYQHGIVVLGLDGNVHLGGLGRTETSSISMDLVDGADFLRGGLASTTDVTVDWYTSLTGRFGVAFEQDWMAYLKGGVAIANVSSRSDASINVQTNTAGFPLPNGVTTASTTSSGIVAGPTFGIGLSKKITENISFGAEYLYVGIPDQSVTAASPLGLLGGGGAPTTYEMGLHTLKATLNYHF